MTAGPASRIATVALVLAVLGLYSRGDLLGNRPVPIALQIAAAMLMLWARLSFGLRSFHAGAEPTAGRIVTRGPYAFIRHPIYASILLFIWAGVFAHRSGPSLALGLLAAGASAVRIGAEERLLAAEYPEYRAYCSRTKRILPHLL